MLCVAFLIVWCFVVIECLLVECFPVFAVLCAFGVTFGDDASVRSTSPSAPILLSGKGEHISCLSLSAHLPSYRIERLLDPTTYIHASQMKPKQPCSSTSQQTLYCYVTLLAAQPLLSMHARMLSTFPLLLLGLGYHIIILLWMI